MMDKAACLAVLGLKPGASEAEVRQAYLELVKVWHPDRFTHDPALAVKAGDKLKEINEAHDRLVRISFAGSPPNPRAQDASVAVRKTPDLHPHLFEDPLLSLVILVLGLLLLSLALFGRPSFMPLPQDHFSVKSIG